MNRIHFFVAPALLATLTASAEVRTIEPAGYAFDVEVTVAGSPEEAYDAFARETREWWDHTFSEKPVKLEIEPWPGGRFVEQFDDAGNGARHATVLYAERGKTLRLEGPLGLSGDALQLVSTLTFAAAGEGTKVKLAVHAQGEVRPGSPAIVENVWKHFVDERFRPYMTGRTAKVGAVRRYRAARKAKDVAATRALLAPDAASWFEKREGPGEKIEADGGGSWSGWDEFFRSEVTLEEERVVDGAVRTLVRETNDWYRLVERAPSRYYMTYWVDGSNRIAGTMVHQIPGEPKAADRIAEFKAWATANRPGLLDQLLPRGRIDPSRFELWKESLLAWRRDAGLGNP